MTHRRPYPLVGLACLTLLATQTVLAGDRGRPPAVPLITHNPYFSAWSTADRPTDDWSRHWTGSIQAMSSMAQVDGKPYRLLGPKPDAAPAMEMKGLEVTPTRTTYTLEGGGIHVHMTFLSPLLPHDLSVLARPVTYLSWDVESSDGKTHDVALYFDATAEFAVNTTDQPVAWSRDRAGKLDWLRVGTAEQPVLAKAGDNLRIDWGYLYVAAPHSGGMTSAVASDEAARGGFAATGKLPEHDDAHAPRPAKTEWPVLAFAFQLGRVAETPQSRHILLAYDELSTVQYMGKRLDPLWKAEGWDVSELLRAAECDYSSLKIHCAEFDDELMADMERLGGKEYARLGALAYRQCLAAHKLALGPKGQPLLFSKENFSNGCIATVDVTYPSSPFFLLFNPTLLQGAARSRCSTTRASDRWKFPFAPHDLGTYPEANGQVYGGGERTEDDQMPVEESRQHAPPGRRAGEGRGQRRLRRSNTGRMLQKWAEYLKQKGLDPENQLCTDDFAGHLAHNANLSVKAIVALGGLRACSARCAATRPRPTTTARPPRTMAARWVEMADDGDHYRLAFDKPGTWSQKYNLVWDRLLGLDLFPPEVVAQGDRLLPRRSRTRYGLPLDNRKHVHQARLDRLDGDAGRRRAGDFEALVDPLSDFARRVARAACR